MKTPDTKQLPQNRSVSESEAKEDENWELVPPDGGWGWLVLGGTLLVNMLIPGTIKSFGVLFVEFLEVFDASPVAASWIPALCYFLYCSLGPVASYLSIKTSFRTVTILGGLFASAGMILSYFANSIIYLYFSYGVMVGIGAGLSFPPGIFIVTSYFVRYRGLANGLAISGSAFGSIILPPFLRFLLETYGYRGAVLIMGGVTLNVLVGALLFEPVEKHMKKVKVVRTVTNGGVESPPHTEESILDIVVPEEGPLLLNNTDGRKTSTSVAFVKSALSLDAGPGGASRKVSQVSRGGLGSVGHLPRKVSAYSRSGMPRNVSVASNMSQSSFRYVSTAFHGSTLVGLHPEFSSMAHLPPRKPLSKRLREWFSGLCKVKTKEKKPAKTQEKKTQEFSVISLLKDPVYLIILLSNATNAIGYTNFTILVPTYAITLGFDKSKASYLLSIVAMLDLVGRIGGSALSDILPIDKKIYFVGGLFVSGMSLAFLPFVSSYNAVAVFCAVFGLASGTYVGITAVIMVDMLGEDLLASSYGISLFVNGVLQLIGPPICGLIFENIQTYGPIFNGLGVSLVLGAAVWGFLPFVHSTLPSTSKEPP